jgi:hypothetical protein
LLRRRRTPEGTHVESRAWVVEEDEKHFVPEILVHLVVHEGSKGATCLSECGRGADVAEKCGEDDDLFNEFRRERGKRRREMRHAPAASVNKEARRNVAGAE